MGIYTLPDIALILGLSYSKVNRWVKDFWDNKLAKNYDYKYSWSVDLTKAVNFYTLIEIYIFYRLYEAGVKPRRILEAHQVLAEQFSTSYPFATKDIIDHLKTDGKQVLFMQNDGSILTLEITRQFKLEYIKQFFKNLDFDKDSLATRFWPLGRGRSIVCDPHHQFGHPVITGTNITVETLSQMNKAGEPVKFIADLYGINENQILDAIEFCKKAA